MNSQAAEFTGFPSVVRMMDNLIHKAGNSDRVILR